MTRRVVRVLRSPAKLLRLIASLAVLFWLLTSPYFPVQAQTTGAPASVQDIADTWQGTLHAGNDLRTVAKITKAGTGYKAVFYSIDQGGDGLPATTITLDGSTVKMTLRMIDGSYEGKLSPDGKTISGNWTQGPNPLPLVLTRATPETEWTIPKPEPKLPPMDANADPSCEVATIQPSKPDEEGKAFLVHGRRFQIINQPLGAILSFAYGVQAKQFVGLPPWADSDKYDIDAKPDGEGAPSGKQWKRMIQKLVAERFKLTFHQEKKEMPVYILSVSRAGSKLNKSEGAIPMVCPACSFAASLVT